jgi:hypothetical protein
MRGEGFVSSPTSSAVDLRVTRRDLLTRSARRAAGAAALGLALPTAASVYAQSATPAPDLSGYQELTVTIADDAITASASEVSPGYLLLTVVNKSATEATAGLLTMPDLTADKLAALAATPTPDDEIPAVILQSTVAGGPQDAKTGETSQAIVKVTPGGWAIFPDTNQAPLFLTVKDGPAVGSEPIASASVQETEFTFKGLDAGIKSGKQFWKVENIGAQPHMLVLGKLPDSTTLDQVMALINSEASGTPVAGGLQESEITDFGGVLLQSAGQTVWPLLDLAAGTYVAVCWVPDPRNGMPHAMEGMTVVFEVTD